MKSTSGAHYVGLDHVRALAAFLVFAWHFVHGFEGYPVPFEGAPFWGPLVFVDEGHVGVALFMTLSGYLFAKLLDGKHIRVAGFLWNRVLRLLPLLALVMIVNAVQKSVRSGDVLTGLQFLATLPWGLVAPSWTNGGWSITAELHFYLVLPLLLFLKRRSLMWLLAILALALIARTGYWLATGSVQKLAYLTIAGRIDQFVLGILAFALRRHMTGAHVRAAVMAALFTTFYWLFARAGGHYLLDGYPSKSALWIVMPLVEGLGCATLIAWYDTSFMHGNGLLSRWVARIGEYSYSIYLLHFFVVFHAAVWIHRHVIDLGNFYVAGVAALIAFLGMVPIGYLSMRFIEAPFLQLRRPYFDRLRDSPRSA